MNVGEHTPLLPRKAIKDRNDGKGVGVRHMISSGSHSSSSSSHHSSSYLKSKVGPQHRQLSQQHPQEEGLHIYDNNKSNKNNRNEDNCDDQSQSQPSSMLSSWSLSSWGRPATNKKPGRDQAVTSNSTKAPPTSTYGRGRGTEGSSSFFMAVKRSLFLLLGWFRRIRRGLSYFGIILRQQFNRWWQWLSQTSPQSSSDGILTSSSAFTTGRTTVQRPTIPNHLPPIVKDFRSALSSSPSTSTLWCLEIPLEIANARGDPEDFYFESETMDDDDYSLENYIHDEIDNNNDSDSDAYYDFNRRIRGDQSSNRINGDAHDIHFNGIGVEGKPLRDRRNSNDFWDEKANRLGVFGSSWRNKVFSLVGSAPSDNSKNGTINSNSRQKKHQTWMNIADRNHCTYGTKERTGVWCNSSDVPGTIMASSVWILIGYSAWTIALLGQREHLAKVHVAAYWTVCVLALACHIKTTLTDPGSIPNYAIPIPQNRDHRSSTISQQQQQEQLHAMCALCQAYKPPLSHHCKICNRCVARMDHHCPWMNNCVGANNLKHFILFLLYVWVGCAMALILFGINYFGCTDPSCEFGVVEVQLVRVMTVLCTCALLFVSSMILNVMYGILTGVGTIDRMQKKTTMAWVDADEEPIPLTDIFGIDPLIWWALPTNPTFPDYERIMGFTTLKRLKRRYSMMTQDVTANSNHANLHHQSSPTAIQEHDPRLLAFRESPPTPDPAPEPPGSNGNFDRDEEDQFNKKISDANDYVIQRIKTTNSRPDLEDATPDYKQDRLRLQSPQLPFRYNNDNSNNSSSISSHRHNVYSEDIFNNSDDGDTFDLYETLRQYQYSSRSGTKSLMPQATIASSHFEI